MSNYADMICKTANDGSPPQLLNSNRICAYLQEAKNEEGLVLQLVMQQIQCGHSDSIVHPPLPALRNMNNTTQTIQINPQGHKNGYPMHPCIQ